MKETSIGSNSGIVFRVRQPESTGNAVLILRCRGPVVNQNPFIGAKLLWSAEK
jgi:hypothetical protein